MSLNDIQVSIREEVARVLAMNADSIAVDSPLVEYGLDSVRAMDLIVGLEERFGIEIDDSRLAAFGCINDVMHCIRELTGQ